MKEEPSYTDKWLLKREQLLKQYPQLTEEDVTYERGKEEELLERLVSKMGKTKNEIREWLALMGG